MAVSRLPAVQARLDKNNALLCMMTSRDFSARNAQAGCTPWQMTDYQKGFLTTFGKQQAGASPQALQNWFTDLGLKPNASCALTVDEAQNVLNLLEQMSLRINA